MPSAGRDAETLHLSDIAGRSGEWYSNSGGSVFKN